MKEIGGLSNETAIELVGPTWRTHVALLANVVYSLALCLLAGVVWLVQDWRHMSLATCLPFVTFFAFWWSVAFQRPKKNNPASSKSLGTCPVARGISLGLSFS